MSELTKLRETLAKIAELAHDGTGPAGGSVIVCTPKYLSRDKWVAAAKRAAEVNPLNRPPVERLARLVPGFQPTPEHIAVLTNRYWGPDGVQLTVGFLDNPPADLRARILEHMNAWAESANVRFTETATDPQVRIARAADGYWSYIGTDILSIPPGEPTMNLEGFTMTTPESEFHRVVRHETGHTLGCPHEHMRRELVERIDPQKAYDFFRQTQGWTEEEVDQQVLTPIEESSLLGTAHADPDSIMCYQIPGSITRDGLPIVGGLDIDPQDYAFMASVYPRPGGGTRPSHWHRPHGRQECANPPSGSKPKGGSSGTRYTLELSEEQKDTIARMSHELHEARATRATRGGEGALGRATTPPGRDHDAALTHWHPVMRAVFANDQPKPPPPPPAPLPTQIGPFNSGSITFDGGVPVGGWSQLTLYQNGSYVFSGHFHDSGAPSYNDSLVWGVRTSSGVLFTFSHSGHMAGTFQSGSRDDDWNVQGTSAALAGAWPDLARGWRWRWEAGVNMDLGALVQSVKDAINAVDTVVQVIAIVA